MAHQYLEIFYSVSVFIPESKKNRTGGGKHSKTKTQFCSKDTWTNTCLGQGGRKTLNLKTEGQAQPCYLTS